MNHDVGLLNADYLAGKIPLRAALGAFLDAQVASLPGTPPTRQTPVITGFDGSCYLHIPQAADEWVEYAGWSFYGLRTTIIEQLDEFRLPVADPVLALTNDVQARSGPQSESVLARHVAGRVKRINYAPACMGLVEDEPRTFSLPTLFAAVTQGVERAGMRAGFELAAHRAGKAA